tara:strand:+ start:2566 stop:3525 length:960 start_codon:yes stop_codon:yes gene_type:complete
MAFLDNSGDIILDAVLTDTGRMRLAKGDGSFKITKFALGDDEINYALYDYTNPSGSAYYDLQIMQTPVLEAFTNNTSQLHSKIISIPRTNLLYLPILKLNQVFSADNVIAAPGVFYVAADDDTVVEMGSETGLINGSDPSEGGSWVRVDQGLDTSEVSPGRKLDSDLVETQYLVEMDSRFGQLIDKTGSTLATISYIDDDQISSYYLSLGTDGSFVADNPTTKVQKNTTVNISSSVLGITDKQAIMGPRGTILSFKVQSSLDLASSTYYFTLVGSEESITIGSTPKTFYFIDTNVRITGVTTGYRIDIPIRYLKYKSTP